MDRIRKEVKDLEAKGYTVFSFHLGDGSWDEFWYVNDFPVSRLRDTFNRVSYPVPLYILKRKSPHRFAGWLNADQSSQIWHVLNHYVFSDGNQVVPELPVSL